MKIKRNKRVEQNLKIRVARKRGKDYGSALSWRRLGASFNVPGRKPRRFLALLEQDVAAQTERLRRLEETIRVELDQAELALVPVLEPVSDVPDFEPQEQIPANESGYQTAPEAPAGRTNYQYIQPSQRVRRRIIL